MDADIQFKAFLREAQREMVELRRTCRKLDSKIKRLNVSTQKNIDEIQKNLEHVKAVR